MTQQAGQMLEQMEQVINLLARGEHEQAQALLQPTDQFGAHAALAESLALLGVRLEAREYSLQQRIDELQAIRRRLRSENRNLKSELRSARVTFPLDSSPALQGIMRVVEKVAPTEATVLISGETGTGKEVLARTIHELSDRGGKRLVAVNCAALPESLLEAELFGIEKGVATGVSARAGKFEAASGGTLFLDEIGDMPLPVQAKVLRAIQEREIDRVGSSAPRRVNVRLISASHQDLEGAIARGEFREDLYFRLNVIKLHMPPLRERQEDVLALARYFQEMYCERYGRAVLPLSDATRRALLGHGWPGNIRELKNAMERAVLITDEDQDMADALQLTGRQAAPAPDPQPRPVPRGRLRMSAEEERLLILDTLRRFSGNRKQTAEHIGIHRETLRLKMKKHSIVFNKSSRAKKQKPGARDRRLGSRKRQIELQSDVDEVPRLAAFVERTGLRWGLDARVVFALNLTLEEVLVNVIAHGLAGEGGRTIAVSLSLEEGQVRAEVRDDAPPFDPLSAAEADTTAPLEQRSVGGLGLHLVRRMTDSVEYRRDGDHNVLTLIKKLG